MRGDTPRGVPQALREGVVRGLRSARRLEHEPEQVVGLARRGVRVASRLAGDRRAQVSLGLVEPPRPQPSLAECDVATRVERVAAQQFLPIRLRRARGVTNLREVHAREIELVGRGDLVRRRQCGRTLDRLGSRALGGGASEEFHTGIRHDQFDRPGRGELDAGDQRRTRRGRRGRLPHELAHFVEQHRVESRPLASGDDTDLDRAVSFLSVGRREAHSDLGTRLLHRTDVMQRVPVLAEGLRLSRGEVREVGLIVGVRRRPSARCTARHRRSGCRPRLGRTAHCPRSTASFPARRDGRRRA